jgi:hypothetical protein
LQYWDKIRYIEGATKTDTSSFIYDAEYSYDDHYQTDSVKVCPYTSKFECIDCHKRQHSNDVGHRMYPIQKVNSDVSK